MRALLITLLVVSIAALPYQAHSFNDLQYFVQLLKKGVRTFKMDLSLLSKESCTQLSTWKETDNTCFTLPAYAEQLCCLGFRGDASSTPQVRYPFNTTKDFLDVLARPELQVILREKIFLAINFQYTDSQNAITKGFLYDVLKVIQTRGLNLTLAVGTDNIILDYDYKCIIQGKCDNVSKYISDSNIVLQSGAENPYHPHDAKKRYRNFNTFYKQVERLCKDGFPSWVDKYDYPLIFWQPSNEQQIQFVLKTFLSSSCKRPAKHNTIKQLAIASNLEPEMFQIYAQGNETDYGFGKRLNLSLRSNPLLTTLTVSNVQHFLLGYLDNSTSKWKIDLINSSNLNQTVASTTIDDGTLINVKGHEDTFAVGVQLSNGSKVYRLYNTSLQSYAELEVSSIPPFTYYKGLIYWVRFISDGYYNWGYTDVPKKSSTLTGCNMNFTATDLVFADTVYIVGTKNGETYMSKNCTGDFRLSFGLNAKVVAADNQLYIVQSGGMCQSAVLMNNNEVNKCNFHQYSEFFPLKNVPFMNTYIAGTVSNIIAEASQNNSSPMGGCSQKVYSAKLVNGNNVSPVALNGRLYLAYEYVPISKQPVITTIFCGGSNFENLNTPAIHISSIEVPPLTKDPKVAILTEE